MITTAISATRQIQLKACPYTIYCIFAVFTIYFAILMYLMLTSWFLQWHCYHPYSTRCCLIHAPRWSDMNDCSTFRIRKESLESLLQTSELTSTHVETQAPHALGCKVGWKNISSDLIFCTCFVCFGTLLLTINCFGWS